MTDHDFTRNPNYRDRSQPSQLSPTLWLSGAAFAQQAEAMGLLGITAVVNLTPDDFGAEAAGFKVLQLGIEDGALFDPAIIGQFLAQMDAWAETGEVVLIHCHAGISRTSSFAIAWLMHQRGVSQHTDLRTLWSSCEDQVGAVRPIIMPHYLLKQGVLTYFLSQLPT